MRRNARRGRLTSRTATSNVVGPSERGSPLAPRLQCVDRDSGRIGQAGVLGVGIVELLDDRFRGAAHHDEVRLVGDRPVVGDAVELGRFRLAEVRHLGHTELDLVRFGLLGEYGAQRLGVYVGQLAARDIASCVGVAARVRVLDAAAAQIVELVEPSDGGEPDPVVELTDLLQ